MSAGNPLRSETAAFHWVLGTLAVAGVVVFASWVNRWLGLAVAIGLLAAAAWWLVASLRNRRRRALTQERAHVEDTPDP